MKELSIEEKAKRYDEAIEIARKIKNGEPINVLDGTPIPVAIFPELKESEDEKIRQFLIHEVTETSDKIMSYRNMNKKDVLAWLEKQGNQSQYWKPSEEQLEALNYAYNSCPDTEKGNYYEGVLETIIEDLYKLTENQGKHKPADKVEPKFKVGDWCIDNEDGTIFKIVKVLDNTYTYKTNEGKEYSCTHYSLENDARLWDVTKDAKDGDVLNSTRVQATIIFKGFADDGKHILAYCALQKGIFIKQEMLWDRDFEPCPKNWNNELFSKMREAGYEWDADKKEPKKIELSCFESALFTAFSDAWQSYLQGEEVNVKQWTKEHSKELLEAAKEELKEPNLAWSEEDDIFFKAIIRDINNIQYISEDAKKDRIDWLKTLRPQKPVEWSVEDEYNVAFVVETLLGLDCDKEYLDKYKKMAKWLKSLKERVQPKQEWSDWDKTIIESIEALCDEKIESVVFQDVKEHSKEIKEWLKNIKERYTWKPSDEQMKALDAVVADAKYKNDISTSGYEPYTHLYTLLRDLKKLREE